MDGNVIPVGVGTTVIVKASGDLFLQGETQMEVRFQSSEDRIRVNQSNDTLYVETHASLDLVVPRSVSVIVEKTGGSAFIQDLDQPLVVQKVGGDLAMRRLGVVRLDKVGGSCLIEDTNQPVTIQKIGGDLTLLHAAAPVQISSIGGSGVIHMVSAGALEVRAGGELKVYLDVFEGPVSMRAGAEAELHLPPAVNAAVILDSGAEEIQLALNNQTSKMFETIEERRQEFKLGEGGVQIDIRAGAEIRMSDDETRPEPIGDELDRRENAWKEARDRRGNFSWSGGFGFDRNSAWADMISRRAQEAAQRAEHRAHAAMRRTEDQIRMAAEREMRRAEVRYGHGIPTPPVPPTPPTPPRVTEQERMLVLEMLRENKISVEQAEKLLAALEGRFEK
jgi:hypothetical protein